MHETESEEQVDQFFPKCNVRNVICYIVGVHVSDR